MNDTQTPEELAEERAQEVPAVADFGDTPSASKAAQSEPVVDLGNAQRQEFKPVDLEAIGSGLENVSRFLSDIQAQQKTLTSEQEQARARQAETVQSEQEVNQLREGRQNLVQRLSGAFQNVADVQRSRGDLEEEADIPELSQEVTEIQNQIEERDHFYRRQVEEVQRSGLSMARANARINDIQRKRATELADLSIIENARLNRLDTAQALVDRKVQLQIEPLETEIQALQFQFDANESLFTTAEKRLFEEQLANKEREKNEKREDAQILEQTKFELMTQALQNNAPNMVLEAIESADTREAALSNAGRFARDPRLDLEMENLRLRNQGQRLSNQEQEFANFQAEIDALASGGGEIDASSTERAAAGYAMRLKNSSDVIDEVGDQFTGFTSRIAGSRFFPQGARSDERQMFDQAKRNFVNAVLRRESGAAIAPEEFASAEQQYFPQPGDSEAVLEQKKRNRQTVFEALRTEAGPAFDQLNTNLQVPPEDQEEIDSILESDEEETFNPANYF